MSKKKIAAIFGAVACAVAILLAGFYFFVLKNGNNQSEFESLRAGMKAWENVSVPGISVYVPEDYTKTENEYYTSYTKGSATVSLTSETVDNDLANYAYYAVRQYEKITDSFTIKEEYDDNVNSTDIHVVEFDYSINFESGVKRCSCLAAYAMGKGRSYIITCVSDADDYSLYREDFHRIYKTIALSENSD
ncbi:MAG: hypothetical protein ACI4KB_02005 [Oscillospiraceae bacterium]